MSLLRHYTCSRGHAFSSPTAETECLVARCRGEIKERREPIK